MLGLRRVSGCQVDIHQGEIGRFVCDLAVDRATSVKAGLKAAAEAGVRHVAVVPGESAAAAMAAVRDFIHGDLRGKVARVTFVLPDLDAYGLFQEALIEVFPED